MKNKKQSEHNNPSLSAENVLTEQVIDLENTSELYLLNTKPKLLSPTQKKLRYNIKKRISYKNKNIDHKSKLTTTPLNDEKLVIDQVRDIENTSDTYLLETSLSFLTPNQKRIRKNLNYIIKYKKGNSTQQ